MKVTAEEQRQVEEQVERLLSGQGSEVGVCDVGLELSKPATLRKNVTYIVCGVIFNDKVNWRQAAPCTWEVDDFVTESWFKLFFYKEEYQKTSFLWPDASWLSVFLFDPFFVGYFPFL